MLVSRKSGCGVTAAVVALGLMNIQGAAEPPPAKDLQLKRQRSSSGRRIRELHFSPDGRLLLAQDDSGLTLLTVQPFSVLFRIPAANITYSGFTPDSRQVLCVSFRIWVPAPPAIVAGPSQHLERWSVGDQARVESAEIRWADGDWGLSPDGRVFVWLGPDGNLSVVDVASSATIFRKKNFCDHFDIPDRWGHSSGRGYLGSARIDFSPDGRFALVSPSGAHGLSLGWDLQQGKRVSLALRLQIRLDVAAFAFIAPDRLLISGGSLRQRTVTAKVVAFPSGQVLSKLQLPPGPIHRAGDPNFVIVRPFAMKSIWDLDSNSPKRSAAVEFRTGRVIVCESAALDVSGRYYAAERTDGKLGLYERGKGLQATATNTLALLQP